MKQGKSRFDFQLNKIATLLQQAEHEEDPALWLFLHDMRTPTFMLEALSKLYANWHNEKAFTKLKDTFKTLEDTLGAIDYYAAFAKEFAANDKIPVSVTTYLEQKVKEKTQILNKILIQDDWLTGKRVKRINDKLDEMDWLNEAQEGTLLQSFYTKQIEKIEKFIRETQFVFDNVEEDVHELRRRMRWLSIYPQALQGAIKLEKVSPVAPQLVKYLTPEIVSSPFNKFPISNALSHFLIFEESYFLSLSWMIAALGKIKDKGLKIEILKEALQETAMLSDATALENTYKILGPDYPKMAALLAEASALVKQYFEEENLKHIIK